MRDRAIVGEKAFNEAEALKPRILPGLARHLQKQKASNEAEALKPRILPSEEQHSEGSGLQQ